jgi:hypothetical protein
MTTTEVTASEAEKLSLPIYLTSQGYEKAKKYVQYATLEGIIEGHPDGNFSSCYDFYFQLGKTI